MLDWQRLKELLINSKQAKAEHCVYVLIMFWLEKLMDFAEKQKGVRVRMLVGVIITTPVLAAGALLNPLGLSGDWDALERLWLVAAALLIPAVMLMISIGRLAMRRFWHAEDIDGGGLTHGTPEAKMLQSILQNTLEQAVLAGFAYVAWGALMPGSTMSTILLAALLFGLGRILFFVSYEKGAPWRGTGFALTFYPTVMMIFILVVYVPISLIAS